ncbi:dual specificity protein phosphatase 19-like isoform 1 [Achlya hypogyna]|uniref:Dual specificity protein phosphatase 19-like isoform 1 n=1 Tax=Achlya hypogyna TaxID=1202772 RepID=A0A1V9Z655_ACHHY|nr:dual specificity protein phosphatase 19-like isoform 1 [Achlya hypogyna]
MDDSGAYEEYYEDEEVEEVEDVIDDVPMFISNRVYLGSIDAAANARALEAKNIRFVLSLLEPEDKLPTPAVAHLRVPMADTLDEPLLKKLPLLLHSLNHFMAADDGNVLVHCVAGRSRSASVVIAWVMTTQQISLDAAFHRVLMARPWISPNETFLHHLRVFEQTLAVPMPAAAREEIAALGDILPRLHFHDSFVAAITGQRKVVTVRLDSDIDDDANSDLQYVLPLATVRAMTTTGGATAAFALLQVTSVDTILVRDLSEAHAQQEGLASVAELLTTLRRFYPAMTQTSACRVVTFVSS